LSRRRGGISLTVEIALISVNNTIDGGATHRGADTSDFFDRRRCAPDCGSALVCNGTETDDYG
jgi:hypothetical protein